MLRRRVTLFTALVSLVTAAEALAASGPPPFISGEPVPVIVTNPSTAPASTTVTNPATAPALTSSVDDPGRIPYQARGQIGVLADCADGNNTCFFTFPVVPTGHRLVVQHVSGDISFGTQPNHVRVILELNQAGATFVSFLAPVEKGLGTEAASAFDQSVLYYVDAGKQPAVAVLLNGGTLEFENQQAMTLTGYLIDCTASLCAPIAP
jgi:hypothetical protein